jgi:hypothetical protein
MFNGLTQVQSQRGSLDGSTHHRHMEQDIANEKMLHLRENEEYNLLV